jgi:hypothetical protein
MTDPSLPAPPTTQSVAERDQAKRIELQHERHPQSPTVRYRRFMESIAKHVRQSADARAERDRDIHNRTAYHREQLPKPKGS